MLLIVAVCAIGLLVSHLWSLHPLFGFLTLSGILLLLVSWFTSRHYENKFWWCYRALFVNLVGSAQVGLGMSLMFHVFWTDKVQATTPFFCTAISSGFVTLAIFVVLLVVHLKKGRPVAV